MDMSGMNMANMAMGSGIPSLSSIQQFYWAVVATAVGIAAVVNLLSFVMYSQRLSAAAQSLPQPAKPKNLFWRIYATTTALSREFGNATLPAFAFRGLSVPTPSAGRITLVMANVATLVVLCFYGWDTLNYLNFESIGYRTGFVTICQLPLVFLLAGKNNVIGLLTGFGYENLNWLHRWSARCMWLTATIHLAYWLADWWPYPDFLKSKLTTDPITYRGLIAWVLLSWVNLSSSMPVRGWGYEFFVVQHVVSFSIMVGLTWWHVPSENWPWIYVVAALFCADRLVRGLNVLYLNLSVFHPRQRRAGTMGLWACKAEFTPLPHDTTRITIRDPPMSWTPGQHMFLSCHSIVPLQSHPFTAASLPSDGRLEFLVRAQRGGTRRFFRHAERLASLPAAAEGQRAAAIKSVALEGPYGKMRPLRQFDSVVLFCGSTGATFTTPLLRDLVETWKASAAGDASARKRGCLLAAPTSVAVTRHVRFVWCVKLRGQLGWFAAQLADVVEDVRALREAGMAVDVDMSVYCTCDDTFTAEHESLLSAWRSSPSKKPALVDTARGTATGGGDVAEKDDGAAKRLLDLSPASSATSQSEPDQPGCGDTNAQCCCRATVEDEDAILIATAAAAPQAFTCTCSAGSGNHAKPADPPPPPPQKFLCHPSIALCSGRPQCRNIMRKSLEQARGESAVVACGPPGLIDDVRRAYVALCDERAVCKGTGAMGVWFHAEGFAW